MSYGIASALLNKEMFKKILLHSLNDGMQQYLPQVPPNTMVPSWVWATTMPSDFVICQLAKTLRQNVLLATTTTTTTDLN
jgi:hypothetical protein